MKKLIFMTALMAGMAVSAMAQKNEDSRWWGGIELRDGYTLGSKETKPNGDKPGSNNAFAVHALGGYYLTENFSVGLGTGVDNFSNPGLTYMPVFLDLRLHPFQSCDNLLVNGQLGLPVIKGGDYYAKSTFDASLGYSFKFTRIQMIPAVGFNYTRMEEKNDGLWDGSSHKRASIYLKLGLTL